MTNYFAQRNMFCEAKSKGRPMLLISVTSSEKKCIKNTCLGRKFCTIYF